MALKIASAMDVSIIFPFQLNNQFFGGFKTQTLAMLLVVRQISWVMMASLIHLARIHPILDEPCGPRLR